MDRRRQLGLLIMGLALSTPAPAAAGGQGALHELADGDGQLPGPSAGAKPLKDGAVKKDFLLKVSARKGAWVKVLDLFAREGWTEGRNIAVR